MPGRVNLYLLSGLFFAITEGSYAMNKTGGIERDTTQQVTIRFEYRLSEVDSTYAGNRNTIQWLDSQFADSADASHISVVKLTSYILPQGNWKFETWLAAKRTATVNDFLKQRYLLLNKAVIQSLQVSDSTEVARAMAADRDLNRVEIQISRSYLAATPDTVKVTLPVPDKRFTVGEARRVVEQEYTVATETRQTKRTTVLALKNNLLYDLALAPNLEIEVPIGKHWSLNTEYKCPWWLNNSRDFCYQLLSGGIEGRYWLGNRKHRSRITGHFIGLYAEGGVYDFQFGGDGYQGKYYGASGLTYGYVKQIARHLALEFSLGVGYLTTEYRKYAPYKDDLIWTNSGRYNFIGPTKAKVSLVWLITTRR